MSGGAEAGAGAGATGVRKAGGKCKICGSETTLNCSLCHNVYYCTRDHQKQDWTAHKKQCVSFKVEENEETGKRLVAIRPVNQGEVIFKEEPLVLGPQHLSDKDDMCVACFGRMQQTVRCTGCGYPLCSAACGQSKRHQPECLLFQVNHMDFSDPELVDKFYGLVTMFRVLFMDLDGSEGWEKVADMETHLEEREETGEVSMVTERVVDLLEEQFQSTKFTEDKIQLVCAVLGVNSFEISVPDTEFTIQGLYAMSSRIQHECVPNVIRSSGTLGDGFTMTIRASVPIKKNETFAMTYADSLWPTYKRRQYLSDSKYFNCYCQRCVDPTELGSYLSGIRCLQCREGFLLPIDPFDSESDWCCEKCKSTAKKETTFEMNSFLEEVVEDLESETASDENCIETYETFIKKYSPLLSPTHHQLLDVKHTLTQLYGSRASHQLHEMNKEQLKKMETYCRQVLAVADVFTPGISRLRSTTLYQLQAAMVALVKLEKPKTQAGKRVVVDKAKEALKHLEDAVQLLEYEEPHTPEGKLYEKAVKEAVELQIWVSNLETQSAKK